MKSQNSRIPSRYFALLCDELQKKGEADSYKLLRAAGIDHAKFFSMEGMLLPEEVEAFISTAERLTNRSDLGFELGKLVNVTSFDVLGLGMISCKNLDQMLQLASRNFYCITETFLLRYSRTRYFGEALYTPAMAMPPNVLRFFLDVLAVAHDNNVRLFLNSPPPTYDIYISSPKSLCATKQHEYPHIRFHHDWHESIGLRIVMGKDMLDRAFPLANSRVVRYAAQRCEASQINRRTIGSTWESYIEMMLRESTGKLTTLEDLARRIGLSARSINRNLRKEGVHFRELSQKVIFGRACELLQEKASIPSVAANLGFSDLANFSRAFKRVVGVSPRQFQRKQSRWTPETGMK